MNRFASILLPLDGSSEAARGASCALWLAQALGATLHVLHATEQPLPAREALSRLRLPDPQGSHVVLHQLAGDAGIAVIDAIDAYAVDLVILSARGETASASLGGVAQTILERSPVPVLLLPARYRETHPWKSVLVAASGEAAADKALEAAAQLAAVLHLRVHVVHSADGAGTAALGSYADSPHHEIAGRLSGMVERGLACCAPDEACCVASIRLADGEPAAVLLDELARNESGVLALGWHGSLDAGRAPVLRKLLGKAECALLLVRRAEHSEAILNVGTDIDQ